MVDGSNELPALSCVFDSVINAWYTTLVLFSSSMEQHTHTVKGMLVVPGGLYQSASQEMMTRYLIVM